MYRCKAAMPTQPYLTTGLLALIYVVLNTWVHYGSALEDCNLDYVNQTTGLVKSPNYGFNYGWSHSGSFQCYWKITVHPGYRIRVVFHSPFDIDHLGYHNLYIYEGSEAQRDRQLYKLNGHKLPVPFTTAGNALYVLFVVQQPDFYIGGKGFSFTFTEYTGNNITLPEVSEGVITNVGYPNKYLPNEEFSWKFSVPSGLDILLKFTDWSLINGDRLNIYSGDSANQSRIVWGLTKINIVDHYRPPETTMPNVLVPGNTAYITLKTHHRGRFAINYRGINRAVCPLIRAPNNGRMQAPSVGLQSVGATVTFSCDSGYKLVGPPVLTCAPDEDSQTTPYWDKDVPMCIVSTECGYNINIQSGSGVVSSPGYPHSYSPDIDCSWYIYTNPDYQIQLTFSGPFGLAYGQSLLDIHDGGALKSSRLARLSGDMLPMVPVSSGNDLLIHFRGNGSSSGAGFSLTYNVSAHEIAGCGRTLTNVLNGTLTNPNYPGKLHMNIRCKWTITVPPGYIIHVIPTVYDYNYDDQLPIRVLASGRRGGIWKAIVLGSNHMEVIVNTAEMSTDQPAFLITFKAIPTQTVIEDAREGILQSPNYPERSGRGLELSWNLTAPAEHRLAFYIMEKSPLYYTKLTFHEYIDGQWTTFASASGRGKRPISLESSTGFVCVNLTTVYDTALRIKYKAFPSTQCPPYLIPDSEITTSGFSPGDQANVSCRSGHALTGPAQLSCILANNTSNQTVPEWDPRDVTCKNDYCLQMLHEINSTSGYVESSGYPAMARLGLTCRVNLTAPEGYVLAIRFIGVRLPYDSPVLVYEGGYKRYELTRKDQPTVYHSTSNKPLLYFKTKGYNGPGFRLVYKAYPSRTPSPLLADVSVCPHPGTAEDLHFDNDQESFQIGDTISYKCRPGTLLIGSGTLTCVNTSVGVAIWDETLPFCSEASYRKCNRTITSGSGLLSPMRMRDFEACVGVKNSWSCSSAGGEYYINSQDCRTYFDLPEGYIVQLQKQKYIDVISKDYLLIYDGLSSDDTLLFNLTYTSIRAQPETEFPNADFNSRRNQLLVRFTSNADSGSRGYKIKYTVIPSSGCPPPQPRPRYGWLQTSREPAPYINGDIVRYGCMEGFNRTGEIRECNGTSHEWTGSNSVCLASPYYERTIGVPTSLYTPSYPNYYFRISRGSWNLTAPPGKGIELFIKDTCRMSNWDDGFHIYANGELALRKLVKNSWYVTNVLNTDPLEVHRIQSNQLHVDFTASFWRSSIGRCDIRLKVFDLPDTCGSPLPGRHRRLRGGSYRVGDSVEVICNDGFYLPDGTRSSFSTCGNDLRWTPEILDCEALCGGNLTSPEGVIYSPKFPDLYPSGQECIWRIDGPVGTIISLIFTLFDLRIGQYNYHDEVSLSESSGQWLFRNYRRNHNGLVKISQTSSVILNLTSSGSIYPRIQNVEALKVIYKAYKPYKCETLKEIRYLERREITPYPDNDTVTVAYFCQYPYSVIGSSVITCLADGQWDSQEPICAGSCGWESDRQSGAILSPAYPQTVSTTESCTWHLTDPGTNSIGIKLEFQNVTLAKDDILAVYDGDVSKEQPTYYNWQTLPLSICGTALNMNVRLVPRGVNSQQMTGGVNATCTEHTTCPCQRTEDGCLKCHKPTDISALTQCLEANGVVDTIESERELNCTVIALARALAQLFGGTVSGIDLSENCTEFSNTSNVSPAVIKCLESSALSPCIPCRTTQPQSETRFWIPFTADVPLRKCQKADLILPHMKNAFTYPHHDWAEVGGYAYVSCADGLVLSGTERGRVMCSHSGVWGVKGLECTCNRVYDYNTARITTLAGSISYRDNLHCTYNINVKEGFIIRLHFISTFIEPRDRLVIYDGMNTSSAVLMELENVSLPPADVYSTGSKLQMVFTSDSTGTAAGFIIEYFTLPHTCDPNSWRLIELSLPGSQSSVTLDEDYRRASVCTWLVTAPPDTAIKITALYDNERRFSRLVQMGIYEGQTIDASAIRTVQNTSGPLPDPHYSRTPRVWFRLTLYGYTRLDVTLKFKAQMKCPRPSHPPNGQITNTGDTYKYAHGKSLYVLCNQGYGLRNQWSMRCVDMGVSLQWNEQVPLCYRTVDDVQTTSSTKVTKDISTLRTSNPVTYTSTTPRYSTNPPISTESSNVLNPPPSTGPSYTLNSTPHQPAQPAPKDAGLTSSAMTRTLSVTLIVNICVMLSL